MAEEKKKPDLKARLNRTVVGAGPAGAPGVAPPGDPAAPMASPASPQGADAAPSAGGDDLVVPDFIRQQMAEKAAAEARAAAEVRAAEARAAAAAKAAAAAADPFSAAQSAPVAASQDIKLFVDGKEVSDDEVGRQNTGSRIGIIATGVVALGLGFGLGDLRSSKREAERTTGAITEVRRSVDTAGGIIAALKEKVDQAATAAGIQAQEGEGQPQAPTATATVNEELGSWFAGQPQEPPFSETAYAGRVGRLRPEVVGKLMKFHYGLNEAWAELRRHTALSQGASLTTIRASLNDLQRVRGEYQRMMVVFAPGTGEIPVLGSLVFTQPGATPQAVTITPVPAGSTPSRNLYTGGDLMPSIRTVGIPVSIREGVGPQVVRGLTGPWSEYVSRLRRLRSLADQLQQDHRALSQALSGSAASGG